MNRTTSLINCLESRDKRHRYPLCPYCGEAMHILIKSFRVCFKTPKMPPKGANDLKLFHITPKTFLKKYAVCPKCDAKYDYDNNILSDFQESLLNIPSSTILLNDFVHNELINYPQNTTCQLLWRRSWRKKRILKKSLRKKIKKIFSLINMFFHV
jgi:hypothetical protein